MNETLTRHLLLPLHERLRGRATLAAWRELCREDRLPPAELQARRQGRLEQLLAHCRTQVPWYRDYFASHPNRAASAEGADALAAFPVMERAIITEARGRLVADDWRDRVLPANTGGSSGEPLTFYTDAVKEARHNAHKLRFRSWFGVRPGDRQVDFWGSPIEWNKQTRLRRWKDRYALNQVILSAFDLSEARIAEYAAFLRRFQPRLVYGYPTVIDRVAQYIIEQPGCVGRWRPRVVVCTSEMLHYHQRQRIGVAFGAPVANEYGSRDAGITAHECRQGQLHIAAQQVWIEVDRPAADGTGDLLITNLDGYGMPLVRYRVGDRGRLGTGGCSCGSPLPVLAELAGRSNDFLVGRDGRRVHSLAALYVLRELPAVRQFRLHQNFDRSLDLELVTADPMASETVTDIQQRLRAVLDLDVSVDVRFTASIPPEPSGKYRSVRSEAVPG